MKPERSRSRRHNYLPLFEIETGVASSALILIGWPTYPGRSSGDPRKLISRLCHETFKDRVGPPTLPRVKVMARASPAGVHRMDPRRRPGSGHQGLPGARRLRQGGRVHRMVEDITLRRHAKELGLKSAPAQPDGGLPDGILVGPQGRMVSFNKKFVEMGHPGQGGVSRSDGDALRSVLTSSRTPGFLARSATLQTPAKSAGRSRPQGRQSPTAARAHVRPDGVHTAALVQGHLTARRPRYPSRKEEKFRCWRPPRRTPSS